MTSYEEFCNEHIGVDLSRASEKPVDDFELSFEPENYYHIICENCKVEEFITGKATLSIIRTTRIELCDCEDDKVKQDVVTEVESAFSCYRCGKSQPSEAIGDGVFCVDCAEKVRNYIQSGGG